MRQVLCICALVTGLAGCGSTTTTKTTHTGDPVKFFFTALNAQCRWSDEQPQPKDIPAALRIQTEYVARLDRITPPTQYQEMFDRYLTLLHRNLDLAKAGRLPAASKMTDEISAARVRLHDAGAGDC